jgi:hypothetical protein
MLFGKLDAAALSAEELAQEFLRVFPIEAALGRGRDRRYEDWLRRLVSETSPQDLIFAFAEGLPPSTGLYLTRGPADPVNLEPAPVGRLRFAERLQRGAASRLLAIWPSEFAKRFPKTFDRLCRYT